MCVRVCVLFSVCFFTCATKRCFFRLVWLCRSRNQTENVDDSAQRVWLALDEGMGSGVVTTGGGGGDRGMLQYLRRHRSVTDSFCCGRDVVNDVHNLGAMIRTAVFLGVDGVVTSAKNCASLTPGMSPCCGRDCRLVRIPTILRKHHDHRAGSGCQGFVRCYRGGRRPRDTADAKVFEVRWGV